MMFDIEPTLALYMRDLSKTKALPAAEEARLSALIQKGDHKARHKLIQANLKFVIKVAMNYRNQGMSMADLVAVGNMGLIRAAHRFDGTKNFKFISYAVWWVRQSILAALANQSRITRIPVNKIGDLYTIRKLQTKLEGQLARKPSIEEISNASGLAPDYVQDVLSIMAPGVYLDGKINNDDNTILDTLSSEDRADSSMDMRSALEDVETLLAHVSEREQHILKLHYGVGCDISMNLEEIGTLLGLSRERVRQIRDRALRRLKLVSRKSLNDYTF